MTPLKKYCSRRQRKFQAYVERHAEVIQSWMWSTWISRVEMIDVEFVKKWRTKSWNRGALSVNMGISRDEKFENPELFFLPRLLETFEELQKCEKSMPEKDKVWVEMELSRNDRNIATDVELYPNFKWEWGCISHNTNITEAFVMKYLDRLDITALSSNKAVSLDFIKKMRHLNWSLEDLARNPNLNEHVLHDFFNREDFHVKRIQDELSCNESISLEYILANPSLGWNNEIVSHRTDITKKHILDFPDFPWNWELLSGCSSIDKNFLMGHRKVNISAFYRGHSGLTIDDVDHLPPDEIFGNVLSGPMEEKADFLRNYYACRVIGNAFFNCYWNPVYSYCRKRLNKRYDELFDTNSVC